MAYDKRKKLTDPRSGQGIAARGKNMYVGGARTGNSMPSGPQKNPRTSPGHGPGQFPNKPDTSGKGPGQFPNKPNTNGKGPGQFPMKPEDTFRQTVLRRLQKNRSR